MVYTKKNTIRYKKKTNYKRKKMRLGFRKKIGLTRAIHPFTREVETYFKLNDLTGNAGKPFTNFVHTSDGGVVGQLTVSLNQLPGYTDFTNLYRQYKITGLKVIFYPASNTTLAGETRADAPSSNNAVLIRVMKNQTGIAIGSGSTISDWNQVQAKKQWMMSQNKPTSLYCPLKQSVPVKEGVLIGGSEEEAVISPKWVSTNNANVTHLGLNIRFDSLNGMALQQDDDMWPGFRIVVKYYLKCKGVG